MKYTCECIKGSLFFDISRVRCSCSNTGGITYQQFNGKNIDMDNINQIRNNVINMFKSGKLPEACKNCYMLQEDLSNDIDIPPSKELERVYISHWLHCNCGCIYCCNRDITKLRITKEKKDSDYYSLYPTIKYLCENGYIGEKTEIHTIGGEPAVLSEFDDIMRELIKYTKEKITFLSSGIDFSQTIYDILKLDKSDLYISIDSGTAETYKKIKRVDAFDKVIENTKKYITANINNQFSVSLKYILINGLNDNINELEKFVDVSRNIGIKKIVLDVNHLNNQSEQFKIPERWYQLFEYFNSIKDMCAATTMQCQKILEKKEVF